MSKKALGKGIGALLNTTKSEETTEGTFEVDIDLVKANPNQPRKTFSAETMEELSQSVKEKGVIQPILVEKNNDLSFTIIAGERRYRAAKMAGLKTIPVRVKKFDEIGKLEISLIENIQREDLTPIEEATAYDTLLKSSKISQDDLAHHLGKNRVTIANSLRLLKLPDSIKDAINNRIITAGHARAILMVGKTQDQLILYKSIVSKGLSVREAETLAANYTGGRKQDEHKTASKKKEAELLPELAEIKQKLIDLLGTKVSIKGTLSKGSIEIYYFSKEDLERLYEILLK
ncbi:MAG: ParB/RepB/Spo0J family partition protein [Spirochaetaceae bacterium]|nr:MAG: ParB/RepB/Spo0J family partition protein [Spirochaetaceae bacterium]